MRRFLRRLSPSMFQRRLLLLSVTCCVITLFLALRVAHLTVSQGAMWRQRAELALVRCTAIPTRRGPILDRHGRILAEDVPGYDLTVRYTVIGGTWAYEQAKLVAREEVGQKWFDLPPDVQSEAIRRHVAVFDSQTERLWDQLAALGGKKRREIDDRLLTIQQRTQRMVSAVQRARLAAWDRGPDDRMRLEQIAQPIGEQVAYHAILSGIDDGVRMAAMRWIADTLEQGSCSPWQHVAVQRSKQRHYPAESHAVTIDRRWLPMPMRTDDPVTCRVDGVGIHLTGGLRPCWKEQEKRPFDLLEDLGGYLPGDLAGEWGLERSRESTLRGVRGRVRHRVDEQRRDASAPEPGQPVQATIDILLQARVHALMDPRFGLMKLQPWHGNPSSEVLGIALRGAAVVLDVSSGEIIAAVSTPGFTRRQWEEDRDTIAGDAIDRRHWNRAVQIAYQPGSTLKPLIYCAAVTDGVLPIHGTVRCNGHLYPERPNRYRCWYYKMYERRHGELNGPESLARSCNIFYYTLGRRLGQRSLTAWLDRFGLGRTTECGLWEETGGDVPSPAVNRGEDLGNSLHMGIGQGPIRMTVMQAANAYATLARHGHALPPTLTRDTTSARVRSDMQVHPAALTAVEKGLYLAANADFGTGYQITTGQGRERIFNLDDVTVYGKTGTAEAAVRWSDTNGNGGRDDGEFWVDFDRNGHRDAREMVPRSDHAWCIAIVRSQRAGASRKRGGPYVIAVLAEYGGSGGRIAGPIVNQIAHALRAEHYL